MNIVADSQMSIQLTGLTEPAHIYDEAGKELGVFIPSPGKIDYSKVVVPFTKEELDAFQSEPGGRPLADILRDLEARS